MKKFFRILLYVIIGVVFIGTIGFLYQKSQPKEKIYEIEKPFITDIENKTVATGTIIPRKEVEIKPRVSGIVTEIYVEPGKVLKEGDLIAKVTVVPDMVSLNNAEARLEQAKISKKDAQRKYDRQKSLFDKGVIPVADLEQAEIALKNAESELDAAENNVNLIKEGVSAKKGSLTNTLIRSTIDGMVLDIPVEQGNSVIESNTFNDGTTIAVVANMNEMIFEGKIDESEVGKIREGMPLKLTVGALEDVTFDAVLEYIAPKGEEEEGAVKFKIKAAVELKKDYFIRSGYSATADIVLERKDSVMAIKESLIKFEDEGDSVYVEVETEPQKFEKRYIDVGISDGINIEVLSGLEKDTRLKSKQLIKKQKKEKQQEESEEKA
ncbi:Cation efflux system protein CzcB [Salinivirga cyanobacteriivorans]|uniref:Cation efflux system protein CzcB n=1 Tax=Salinivirga cyanobacteriivorans TaxID=1307839 RepID=A0A0S2HXW6_9BACT|nr:efflux RND transporter periplasmic adaptor subunit [Salinivirga cyanobacteriivorans]ALO14929.1 Cation efflux system protein CzcB [Salinivirga cyanobacteriivorans]